MYLYMHIFKTMNKRVETFSYRKRPASPIDSFPWAGPSGAICRGRPDTSLPGKKEDSLRTCARNVLLHLLIARSIRGCAESVASIFIEFPTTRRRRLAHPHSITSQDFRAPRFKVPVPRDDTALFRESLRDIQPGTSRPVLPLGPHLSKKVLQHEIV